MSRALKPIVPDRDVLDIGAGSGAIALIAAASGARRVVAIERPEVSYITRTALDRYPQYRECIEIVEMDIFEYEPRSSKFDVIISETIGYLGYEENMAAIMAYAAEHVARPDAVFVPSSIRLDCCPIYIRSDMHVFKPYLTSEEIEQVFVGEHCTSSGPHYCGHVPSCVITASHSWRSRESQQVNAVSITFDVELREGINLNNRAERCWPRCIVPMEVDIMVQEGSIVSVDFSIWPECTEYQSRICISVDDVVVGKRSFSATEIVAPTFEPSDCDVDDVADSLELLAKELEII